MYNFEDLDPEPSLLVSRLSILPIRTACVQAKQQMGALHPFWYTASCEEVQNEVCGLVSTIFTADNPIRLSLCGTATFPAPKPWPSVTGGEERPPVEGGNTLLAVAGLAMVGILGAVIAKRR